MTFAYMPPSMDLLGNGRLCNPGMRDIILAVSMFSVQTWALLLVVVGRKIRKLKFWFLEVLNIVFFPQAYIKNIANSLETFGKMVMWIVFHVHMNKCS